MRARIDSHLDDATLRALALDAEGAAAETTAHLAACGRCQAAADAARRTLDSARADADAAVDAVFSAADLERQRRSVLARVMRGHRSARVLAFPGPDPGVARPHADRRWLAAAAAAGLVLGALAGQVPHLRTAATPAETAPASSAVTARAETHPFDDTLLSEVEAALAPGTRPELRALDALTPVHYEIR